MGMLFESEIRARETVIFHTDFTNLIENEHLGTTIKVNFPLFSIQALKKNPIKNLILYRNVIKEIRAFCKERIRTFDFAEKVKVIIGTDKDNFTQIFLNHLYREKHLDIELIAVEEGSGFYREEDTRDWVKTKLYGLLTPVLFGERIVYHKQLGTDKRIDKVFARLPEYLPKNPHSANVEYSKYNFTEIREFNPSQANGVLIFSFPNKNYPVNDTQQIEMIETIMERLGKGKEVFIKPHPRESLEVVNAIKGATVIDQSKSGEELDYFRFEKIINFNSSIVIDLLGSGYPKERIYTINLDDSNISFFKETNYINITDIKRI